MKSNRLARSEGADKYRHRIPNRKSAMSVIDFGENIVVGCEEEKFSLINYMLEAFTLRSLIFA